MTKRQRIITPVGRTAWCHVLNPRESLGGKMQWDVALEIDEDWIKQYSAIARQLIEDARSGDPNFPRSDANFTYPWMQSRGPKDDAGNLGDVIEGKWLIKAKRNAVRTRGGAQERNTAPILQDGLGQPIKPGTLTEVPPSTEARLMIDLFCFHQGANAGVSAGLIGMQIKKLGASDSFDPLEGFDAVEKDESEEMPF